MKKSINIPKWYKNNRLVSLRKEHEYNQTYVAEQINCVLKTYQNYEQGRNFPTLEYADSLANLYGVSIDYLLGRSDCHSVENEYIHRKIGLNDTAISKLSACHSNRENNNGVLETLNIILNDDTELLTNIFNYIVSDYRYYSDNNGTPQSSAIPLINSNYLLVNEIPVANLSGAILQTITENIITLKSNHKNNFTFVPQPLEYYLNEIIENKKQIDQWQKEIEKKKDNLYYLHTLFGSIDILNEKNHNLEQIILINYCEVLKSKQHDSYTKEQKAILNNIYTENDFVIENVL